MRGHNKPVHAAGIRPVDAYIRFYPQGNSATPLTVAAATMRDPGGVALNTTRTGAGHFRVYLRDSVKNFIGIFPKVQLSANNVDLQAELGDVHETTGVDDPAYFDVRLMTG